jgi:hypothetical protein
VGEKSSDNFFGVASINTTPKAFLINGKAFLINGKRVPD